MALGAWFTDLIGCMRCSAFRHGRSDAARHRHPRSDRSGSTAHCGAVVLRCSSRTPGLNTKIGLLNSGFLWLMCGAVLLAAILGKGVACWLAARATGISIAEALGIGTLMNARA